MDNVLTLAEIRRRFIDEWVLVQDPQTNEALDVQGGRVVHHSKDRDEVYRQAIALRAAVCGAIYRCDAKGYGDRLMNYPFTLDEGLIVVQVEIVGPTTIAVLRMALDTGATTTLINVAHVVALGYDPAMAPARVQVTTGSGVEFVPRLPLTKIAALGQDRCDFPVLCHTLPPSALIDGLLGLDFFHGTILTLDLKVGQISLT